EEYAHREGAHQSEPATAVRCCGGDTPCHPRPRHRLYHPLFRVRDLPAPHTTKMPARVCLPTRGALRCTEPARPVRHMGDTARLLVTGAPAPPRSGQDGRGQGVPRTAALQRKDRATAGTTSERAAPGR